MLFCDDAVARQVRRECDRLVFLGNGGDDSEEAQRRLWLRKYRRKGASGSASTNRKLSYEERGVTQAQYKVYWDHYIEPSWQRHGARRLAAVLAEALAVVVFAVLSAVLVSAPTLPPAPAPALAAGCCATFGMCPMPL